MLKSNVMNNKAYFGIKFYEDNRNRHEIDSICSMIHDEGIQTTCIARDIEEWGEVHLSSQELMRITFEEIDKSDFVVLEMSEKGVGLGIEAGYTVARNKPLIVLIKYGLELSNTMQGIADTVITYNHPEEIKISAHNKALHRTQTSCAGEH
jgi:2'-deoxynucleoside 5'-phosphate N-hydrolase